MVNELVACVLATFLHHLGIILYGAHKGHQMSFMELIFISLRLMWPGLRAPSEFKR